MNRHELNSPASFVSIAPKNKLMLGYVYLLTNKKQLGDHTVAEMTQM